MDAIGKVDCTRPRVGDTLCSAPITAGFAILPEVLERAVMRMVPAGSYANLNSCASSVSEAEKAERLYLDLAAGA